jgi:hypothetical protein
MKNSFLLCLLMLAICLGCKKEDSGNDEILYGCDVPLLSEIHDQYPIFSSLVANPTNPDEFILLRDKFFFDCCEQELLLVNIATKELKKIYQGTISNVEWNDKDWILFMNTTTNTILKIRPTGDSLLLIMTGFLQTSPFSSSLEGDRFFSTYNPPLESTPQHGINKINGDLLAHVPYVEGLAGGFLWHHDSILTGFNISNAGWHLNFYSVNKFFETPEQALVSTSIISNIVARPEHSDWADETTLVVSTVKGLYTVDMSDVYHPAKPILIWDAGCIDAGNVGFTVQRAEKKLIVQRYFFKKNAEKDYTRQMHFVRMNLDGTNEEVIEIPGL